MLVYRYSRGINGEESSGLCRVNPRWDNFIITLARSISMQSRFGRFALLAVLLLLIGSSLSLVPILAQGNDTILTIAVDQWQADYFNDEVFAAFEEAHPGVKVVTVTLDDE